MFEKSVTVTKENFMSLMELDHPLPCSDEPVIYVHSR